MNKRGFELEYKTLIKILLAIIAVGLFLWFVFTKGKEIFLK